MSFFVWFLQTQFRSTSEPRAKYNQNLIMSGAKRIHLGYFFCLIALLAHLVLPLAHQFHLHQLEELNISGTLDAGQVVAVRFGGGESEPQHHSHHDATSCPICQAAFRARCFMVPAVNLATAFILPVQRLCHKTSTIAVANPDILVSGPRSPPVSL